MFFWATASDAALAGHAHLPTDSIERPLLPWQRLAGRSVMGVPLALLLAGVWQARRCFEMFARGRVFTAAATRLLRSFAGWVAWAA